jgi:phospholipid/cholesterol/gamma-HCH transport system substrate-binding protein
VITKRTKVQLIIFVVITLLGVSFVGAKYAQLDRLVVDQDYTVTAHFPDSGGIFSGAEVTYRGVTVGRVGTMKLTSEGVDVDLDIDKSQDKIPSDTKALVGNRSAVGEQYVELQPLNDREPYLADGGDIPMSNTAIPISTSKWLSDTNDLVNSIPKRDLRTVVDEFGAAFHDGGDDLSRLIDSSTSFIDTANRNFGITDQLLSDSRVVLSTQLDKASAIRSFSRNLSLVSDTLVARDADLRRIIENGSETANQLRTFLEDNKVDLAKLLNNLVTTGEVQVKHLDDIEMLLVAYPYVVAGGFAVNDKTPETGLYDAHFGLILTSHNVCHAGYQSTDRRPPQQRGNRPMNEDARCTEPAASSDARGVQNARRVAPGSVPTLATYDRGTGKVTYTDQDTSTPVTYSGGAGTAFGKESWKWLLLQPLVPQQ